MRRLPDRRKVNSTAMGTPGLGRSSHVKNCKAAGTDTHTKVSGPASPQFLFTSPELTGA
jgi:hypothetical protein